MTRTRLWTFLAVGLPMLGALLGSLWTVDLTYHLRAGAIFLDTGQIATTDSFTFTAPGAPWLNQQWAAQAILAAVYKVGGWSGLVVFRTLLVGLLAWIIFITCRRQGVSLRVAAWLTLGAFVVAEVTSALRPQLFGMLLFALSLLLITSRRRNPRLLWLMPVLTLAWANLHGSFVLGPLVLGLAWLEDLRDRAPVARQTILAAFASAAATLVNPFGLSVWQYALGLSTNSFVTTQIAEWQPATVRSALGLLFFASVLAVVAILARIGRPTPWTTLANLAVFFAIGAYAIRGIAWWPIAAVVALAPMLAQDPALRDEVEEAPKPANRLLAAAIGFAILALLPFWRPPDPGLGAPLGVVGFAPSDITRELRAVVRPDDRIFAPQAWGSWIEFAFPQTTVATDSRIEMYPKAVWDAYAQVTHAEDGWDTRLDEWGVTVVLARDDGEGPLVDALDGNPAWRQVYSDEDGHFYVRADRSLP